MIEAGPFRRFARTLGPAGLPGWFLGSPERTRSGVMADRPSLVPSRGGVDPGPVGRGAFQAGRPAPRKRHFIPLPTGPHAL